MNDLPPEVRVALTQLLIQLLHELARLIAAVVSELLGVKVIPVPTGASL